MIRQLKKLISIFNSNKTRKNQEKGYDEISSPNLIKKKLYKKKSSKGSRNKEKLTNLEEIEEIEEKKRKTVDPTYLNTLISIDNAIVNAAQNLLLSEKRIIMLALTQISNLTIEQSSQSLPIRITAKQFSLTYKINIKTAYEQLHDTCDKLLTKHVSWHESTPKGPHEIKMNWLTSCRYAPKEAFVELSFSPEIKKHLLELRSNFTTYKLEQTRALRSIYSWRLLELLAQFKGTGWRQFDLYQFLIAMNASQYYEKNFSDIRRKIIQPAVKELNAKEKSDISWKTIKEKNKVIAIHFEFKKEPSKGTYQKIMTTQTGLEEYSTRDEAIKKIAKIIKSN